MAPAFFTKAFKPLRFAASRLARLRGVAIVVAGGLLIFAVAHYALAFALGADAAAIHPRQRPLGLQIYEKLWGRMSAIDHLYHRGQLSPNMRLGVFIGVSTTATGIQRRFLDAEASVADRWIVLSGAGLSFENIENVMQPVFFCSLRPSAVVFGVHPQMLVGERYLGDEPTVDQQRVVGRRRGIESRLGVLRALGWLRKHWAIRNRAIVADYLHTQMYIARLWVFSWARVSADKLVTPVAEPWDEDPFWLWNMDDAENHFAQDQVTFWKKRGHFTPENYDPDGVQARCFVRMIRAYRTLGAGPRCGSSFRPTPSLASTQSCSARFPIRRRR